MLNTLLSRIKDRYEERQEETARTFAELVNDVVDAEQTGISKTLKEDIVIERLEQLRKAPEEFEAAVEYVTVFREYTEIADAAEWSDRPKLLSLNESGEEILAWTDYLRQCLQSLTSASKLSTATAELDRLMKQEQEAKDAADAALEKLQNTRKSLSEPLSRARSKVSQCELAIDKLKKLVPPLPSRELKLRQRRQQLIDDQKGGFSLTTNSLTNALAEFDREIAAERAKTTTSTDSDSDD